MYWLLSAVGSVMGLGGRGGRLRASSVSHSSSTDECPLNCSPGFLVLTWIFFWSRCPAKLLSETLALLGSPALWFRMGIRLVSRVLSFGWKYFRAWKSLWMACPTTILSFRIFRIWKCQKELGSTAKETPLKHKTNHFALNSAPSVLVFTRWPRTCPGAGAPRTSARPWSRRCPGTAARSGAWRCCPERRTGTGMRRWPVWAWGPSRSAVPWCHPSWRACCVAPGRPRGPGCPGAGGGSAAPSAPAAPGAP
uniref:Uncharacterized protein n=1 Tax=Otus sunia TaxID=257818 RepID=A0A8C8AGW0_9STRI